MLRVKLQLDLITWQTQDSGGLLSRRQGVKSPQASLVTSTKTNNKISKKVSKYTGYYALKKDIFTHAMSGHKTLYYSFSVVILAAGI